MRYGKIGLQLGSHQKYYISKCEENHSIQLTITVDGNNSKSSKERKELIDDITKMMDGIMKLFMPTVSERATILFPCPLCPTLHITMNDVCNDNIIFCAKSSDAVVPPEFYCNLLPNHKQGNFKTFCKSSCIDQHACTTIQLCIFPYFSISTIPRCK